MRVVLDTNILISAFVFPGGTPEAIFRAALEDRIRLVTSPALMAEFGRVLSEEFEWDARKGQDAVALIVRIGDVVRPAENLKVIEEDPADDRVLEAAAAGDADVIVAGDRHLLRLGVWEGIRVERAAAFLKALDAD